MKFTLCLLLVSAYVFAGDTYPPNNEPIYAQPGAPFSADFPVSLPGDFLILNLTGRPYPIATGRVTSGEAIGWAGSGSTFVGTIPSLFRGVHTGTFFGTFVLPPGGGGTPPTWSGSAKSTVARVESVVWCDENKVEITTPNDHPTFPFGHKYDPSGKASGEAFHSYVYLKIKLDQPVARKVYLKLLDIDDPDTDAVIDTNALAGDDNVSHFIIAAGPFVTNDEGIAYILTRCSTQPGDNAAVAATTDEKELEGITTNTVAPQNTEASNFRLKTGVVSKMLTIWRTLDIELASMERPTFKERESSYFVKKIKSIRYKIKNRKTIIQLGYIPPAHPGGEDNGFQNGAFLLNKLTDIPSHTIYATGVDSWSIFASKVVRDGSLEIEVSDLDRSAFKAGKTAQDSKQEMMIVDDDWCRATINNNPIDGQFPFRLPILPSMALVYKESYITIKEDPKPLLTIPFSDHTIIFGQALVDEPSWTNLNSSSHWAAHVITACQAQSRDRDPDVPPFSLTLATTPGITKSTSSTCVVFAVTCNETFLADSLSHYVVAHEVGHAGGLWHGAGLMDENDEVQTASFSPKHKAQLRAKTSDW